MATIASLPSMPAHQRTLSSVSSSAEDLFSSITGFDDLANDDDLSLDDLEDGMDGSGKNGGAAKKGRRLASTAEKKATHNAVERARRESLNVRFLVLADMLPGMNHVKRASKAGIVNKSIALIQELQATEKRLGTENEALKAELEVLRQQAAQAGAAAAASAAAAAGMMPPMHFHGMQGMNGMHNMSGMMQHQQQHMPPHHQHSISQPQQQMQQAQNLSAHDDGNNAHSRRSSAPSSSMPIFPGYPGMFGESNNDNNGVSGIKSEPAGSPSSDISKPSQQGVANHDLFANGLFDFTAMTGGMPVTDLTGQTLTASPASYSGNSPPGTMASLISDKAPSASNGNGSSNNNALSNNNNPSPASSHSISTPGNTFSPAPLTFDPSSSTSAAAVAATSSTSSPPNPVLAAFDSTSDPAFLAAQYAPGALAKAQSELQAFMAYQQRMAAMGAGAGAGGMGFPYNGGNSSPTHGSFPAHAQPQPSPNQFGMHNQQMLGAMGFPFSSNGQFPGPQNHPGMCAPPPGLAGIPAWQMMIAQQQALSTYGGLGGNQF